MGGRNSCFPSRRRTPAETGITHDIELQQSTQQVGNNNAKEIRAATAEMERNSRTIRRNIVHLWVDSKDLDNPDLKLQNGIDPRKELDRIMIALHELQTKGRIAYRRLVGMHGGGGGNSDDTFRKLLEEKCNADIGSHYDNKAPDYWFWPQPVENAPEPKEEKGCPFTYTFCWHAKRQFIIWHRPLMREFEKLLQEYDPEEFSNEQDRYFGNKAIGAPYWAWEHWEGDALPQVLTTERYHLRSDIYKNKGYSKGSSFPNPFYRWLAPVTVEDQINEIFPDLNDKTCTIRSPSFKDPTAKNGYYWIQSNAFGDGNPPIHDVIDRAMRQPIYDKFATVEHGHGSSQWSIEYPHNKFHNYIGGNVYIGKDGTEQKYWDPPKHVFGPDAKKMEYTGTMTQNQSIFDPIFWLHHSNVERQLCSWQKIMFNGKTPYDQRSVPEESVLDTVLYPWTKPELLEKNKLSWNTPKGSNNDGTLRDWFFAELHYTYDDFIEPTSEERYQEEDVYVSTTFDSHPRGGTFELLWNGEVISKMSLLSSWGSGCSRCETKSPSIEFDISHLIKRQRLLKNIQGVTDRGEFVVRRGSNVLKTVEVKVTKR